MYKRYCNNKYQRLLNPCCCIVNKKIIKKVVNNHKCLNSPNHSLSDFSSLPESENIPSNLSFASKKIFDVIFYLIKNMEKILLYSANRKYEKTDISQSVTPRQKTNSWFRRQKAELSENVYRIMIAWLLQKLWANHSKNY